MPSIGDQIRDVERNIDCLQFQLAVEQGVLARLKAIDRNGQSTNGKDRMIPGSLASQIREVFIRLDRAISVDELVKELEAKGVSTTAQAGLKGSVASILSKGRGSNLFRRVSRGIYQLKKEPGEAPQKE